MRPLAIDLFAGLGGWTEGLLAEGYDVIGFDIEAHRYGDHRYPAQLVVQDVLTLHGSQFKDADLIVASPPCQEYSYMAMPWKKAKAKAAAIRADDSGKMLADLNRLFDACFRIQAQASLAAGRHIPMIVENVRGAQPWVGRSRWSFGSFHLWGDVPALMPITLKASKVPGFRFDGSGASFQTASVNGLKAGDAGWRERGPGRQPQDRAIKNMGGSWFNVAHNTTSGKGNNPDGRKQNRERLNKDGHNIILPQVVMREGVKNGNDWFSSGDDCSEQRRHGSKSTARKAASAIIAKIPLPLASYIARVYRPAA